jgi:hypothetical protein
VPGYRARLADSLRRLARLKLDAGDAAGADADARRAVTLFEALPSRDSREWFWLACARTTLAAVAGASRGVAGTSAALEPGLADRAMNDLRQAIAAGYRSPAVYRNERALGPLRGRVDFKLLMMDLAMPANPFAGAR